MQKIGVSIGIGILILSTLLNSSAAGKAYNWYCKRNKNHEPPQVEVDMAFIENYDAYYVDSKATEKDKVVYLTFDAGYENGNVEKILDTLKAHQAPGAFFILKNLITKNTDLVKRMVEEGHTVCNHTMNHHDMTTYETKESFAKELHGLEDLYRDTIGQEMAKYYRPPEGRFNEENLKFASELGYKTIFWSFAYADWDNEKQPNSDEALKKILDNIHNGAVILLHPTSATNAAIMDSLLSELERQGYRFGTLEELTAAKG